MHILYFRVLVHMNRPRGDYIKGNDHMNKFNWDNVNVIPLVCVDLKMNIIGFEELNVGMKSISWLSPG